MRFVFQPRVRGFASFGLLALTVTCLSGCGGGGGGAGSSSSLDLSLTPSSISTEVLQGDAMTLETTARVFVDSEFSDSAFVIIRDRGSNPIMQSASVIGAGYDYRVEFRTREDLPAGRYSSSFQIDVCSSPSCSTVYASERFAYVLQVKGAANLTALTPLGAAGDWTTPEGNPGRSNYVPVTLDPARFSPRWRFNIPDFIVRTEYPWNPPPERVLSADGAIFFRTMQGTDTSPQSMLAVNEADGSLRWSQRDSAWVMEPVVANGVVYAGTSNDSVPGIRGYDLATGGIVADIAQSYSSSSTLTPADGRLLYAGQLPDQYSSHLVSMNLGTQQIDWSNDFTSPVVPLGDTLLTYTPPSPATAPNDGGLYILRASDGAVVGSIADPDIVVTGPSEAPYFRIMLIPGNTGEVLGRSSTHVALFDTTTGTRRWTAPGRHILGAGEGVTYLYRSETVHVDGLWTQRGFIDAVSNANGTTLWSWEVPRADGILVDVVFTKNIAFISTGRATYAVDLATRATVWTYPRSGELSISRNGVLYIVRGMEHEYWRQDGTIIAINLH